MKKAPATGMLGYRLLSYTDRFLKKWTTKKTRTIFDKKPNESKKASKSGIFSSEMRIKNKTIELTHTTRRMTKRERLVKIKPSIRKTDTRPMI
ncbi:hypothetical protein [Exiguobacterium artemiae]|uniref:hypothetical protein n=1 Tax=Exiguobacterium artemiae TaxID=340145 RepID=UPI003D038D99